MKVGKELNMSNENKKVKLSLKDKIVNAMREIDAPVSMSHLYAMLPNEKKHCIRARVYNHLVGDFKYNKNTKNLFVRLEGSLYMLAEKLEATNE
jgi:hypothetical protein